MISSLYNGITGLFSHESALNVESNNIANVNTVGYKSDRISFSDLLYVDRIGHGAQTQSIQKDFTTGNINITGNSYDVAIEGNGFFIVQDPNSDARYYTKAGNFLQDVNGFLTTQTGEYVQGVSPTITGDLIANDLYTQFISSNTIEFDTSISTTNARATDYAQSAEAEIDPITGRVTKTQSSIISDIQQLQQDYNEKLNEYANTQIAGTASTNQISTTVYNDYATQLTQTGDIVSIVIDNKEFSQEFTVDAQTTMQLLAEQISSSQGVQDANFDAITGALTINTLIPGENLVISGALINSNAYNVTQISAVKGTGEAAVASSFAALETAIQRANAQIAQVTTSVSTATTPNQVLNLNSLGDLQLNLTQLGISDNQFSQIEIDNGVIYMSQGDNRYVVGRIQTAGFADELSLDPQGGNLFAANTETGDPLDSTSSSKLIGRSLELSNANLSESLVNLIVYQRAFEANSKTITTSDEFLSTAIQLKR